MGMPTAASSQASPDEAIAAELGSTISNLESADGGAFEQGPVGLEQFFCLNHGAGASWRPPTA
jgi:hypothetical protein